MSTSSAPPSPLPESPAPSRWGGLASWAERLRPSSTYWATPLLVGINLLVYLLMVVTGSDPLVPHSTDLIRWGSNHSGYTLAGQSWRLLSYAFVHVGFLHLLINLLLVVQFGSFLERKLDPVRLLVAYLLAAVGGGLASLVWYPLVNSAGASGAACGLLGLQVALLLTKTLPLAPAERRLLLAGVGLLLVYLLFYNANGGVDHAAHAGGLATGIGVGLVYALGWQRSQTAPGRRRLLLGLLVVSALGAGLAYRSIPNRVQQYEGVVAQFWENERAALTAFVVYNQAIADFTEANRKMALDSLVRAQQRMAQNITLLGSQRGLPPDLQADTDQLLRYAQLRKEQFELMHKALSENTDRYDQALRDRQATIDRLIAQLDGPAERDDPALR